MERPWVRIFALKDGQAACPPEHLNRYYELLGAAEPPTLAVRCMQCNKGWYMDPTWLDFTCSTRV